MSELGFKDPDESFPREEYVGKPTTNKAAREEWESKIVMPDGVAGTDLVKTDWQPKYPYNKVEETSSGHRVEHDDTQGGERLSYVHKDGTGIEMYPGGTDAEDTTTILVNSTSRMVQLVGDDFVMVVNGNGNVTYKGTLNLTVEGDFNVNCDNYTVTTKGKQVEEIAQDKVENFVGDRIITTEGNKSEIVFGNYTLGALNNTYIFAKNYLRMAAEKDIDIYSGRHMTLTAKENMTSSALANRLIGITTSVLGSSGTIGGNNVVMYSKSLHTDTVDATTIRSSFVGDLKGDVEGNLQGNADTATQAGSAGTAGAIGAGGSAGTEASPSVTEIGATTTAKPTAAILTEGQAKTYDIGIRKPLIDEAIIKNSISGGAQTTGASRTPNPKNAADTFDDGKTTEQKKEDAQYGNEFDTQNSYVNDFDGGTNSVTQNVLRTKSGSVVTSSDGSPVYVDN